MKTRTQSSCERLSFASSQKDSILFLETFEKHISELDTEDIYLCTDVAVCKKDKIYVTIGDLSFALNNKDYDELISFLKESKIILISIHIVMEKCLDLKVVGMIMALLILKLGIRLLIAVCLVDIFLQIL